MIPVVPFVLVVLVGRERHGELDLLEGAKGGDSLDVRYAFLEMYCLFVTSEFCKDRGVKRCKRKLTV